VSSIKNKIWWISLVSFFWSTSSMMVGSILPIYLTEQLKIGYVKLGYLEGIAIGCAFFSKVFAGILSDKLKKRKILVLAGSMGSVVTKMMLALASSYYMVFLTRFIDRLAKGIRSAPTDALIADLNQERLNYAFGCRQAIYILGAVFGALLAVILMLLIGNNYRLIFYASVLPALLAVLILIFCVQDPDFKTIQQVNFKRLLVSINDFKNFSWYYWFILVVTFFLMIARFSESFLTLRVKAVGWPILWLPAIIIISDITHSIIAFITRSFSGKDNAEKLLLLGLAILIVSNIIWLHAYDNFKIILGIISIGMHLGITQGTLRTLIAISSAKLNSNVNGTAFALVYLVSGCGVFIGNLLAGSLAEKYNLATIFIGGMVAAGVALSLLLLLVIIKIYWPKIYDAALK